MSPSSKHFLSLIVPSYRQEKTIVKNVLQLTKVLNQIRYNYEILVVIDGKVDSTLEKIQNAQIPKVICLSYELNRGKSFAIRLGMSKAKGDYVMFIDSGMEIDPNGISMLVEHMEWYNADVIVGSKRHPASYVDYTWQRKVLSYGYYYFVKFVFGVPVHDTQAGIKIFKKHVLEKVLPRLVEKRFAGDLEMLVVTRRLGFQRIFEAPIRLNYEFSALTSAATWKSVFFILVDTLAIFYRAFILDYYSISHRRTVVPDDLKIYKNKKYHLSFGRESQTKHGK